MRGWRWIALGVAGILGATAIVSLLVGDSENKAFVIPSESMQPTLQAGERVRADLNAYKDGRPEINDIVVFLRPAGRRGRLPIRMRRSCNWGHRQKRHSLRRPHP